MQVLRNTLDKIRGCLTGGYIQRYNEESRGKKQRRRGSKSASGPQRAPLKVLPSIMIAPTPSDSVSSKVWVGQVN